MTTTIQPSPTDDPPRHRRRKLWLALGILAVLVVGFVGPRAYLAVSLRNSGESVDIGGREMYFRCSGTGSPTVVLEHGLGSTGLFEWEAVQASIDDTTRVCYTSRAGMGFSDPAPEGALRTAQDAADDLAALLDAADIVGPYVMVGHSFGGPVVRLFAADHPDEVIGMVLVDSTHEELTTRTREAMSPEAWAEVSGFLGANNENMDLEASGAQVAAAGDLGDIPLVVLQAGRQDSGGAPPELSQEALDELEAVTNSLKDELQMDLVGLSSNGRHVLVDQSGHFIQIDRPDAVIDAINSILDP